MSHVCDFPTAVRLLDVDTLAAVVDFHDPASGVDIAAEIILPTPNKRQRRLKSARVRGSFPVGARLDDDGTLVVPVNIFGATWAIQQQNYLDLYAAMSSADEFFVETELSGVSTRWYTDAPVDVFPDPLDVAARINNSHEYELRFLVQPNPTVVIA